MLWCLKIQAQKSSGISGDPVQEGHHGQAGSQGEVHHQEESQASQQSSAAGHQQHLEVGTADRQVEGKEGHLGG